MTAFNLTSLIITIGIFQSAFALEDHDATKGYVSRKTQTLPCNICDLGGGEPVSSLTFELTGHEPSCYKTVLGPPLLSCEDGGDYVQFPTGSTVIIFDEHGIEIGKSRTSRHFDTRLVFTFTNEVPLPKEITFKIYKRKDLAQVSKLTTSCDYNLYPGYEFGSLKLVGVGFRNKTVRECKKVDDDHFVFGTARPTKTPMIRSPKPTATKMPVLAPTATMYPPAGPPTHEESWGDDFDDDESLYDIALRQYINNYGA